MVGLTHILFSSDRRSVHTSLFLLITDENKHSFILLIVLIRFKNMQTQVQVRIKVVSNSNRSVLNASFPWGMRFYAAFDTHKGAFKPGHRLLWPYLGCSFPRFDAHRSQASSQLWHIHLSVLVGVQCGEQLVVRFGPILGRGAPAVGEKQLSYKRKHSCTEKEETACRATHSHTECAKKFRAGTSGLELRVRI